MGEFNRDEGLGNDALMLEIQPLLHELAKWRVKFSIDKYVGDWTPEQIANGEAEYAKYERYESEGNLLMNGGVSCLWQALIGNGTGTAGQTLTYFNNGNAAIGVGDNNTAAAATQNDLQASTNKLRKAMDASNPAHTDGTTSGSQSIQFKSTFGTSDANWAWEEWAVFNSPTAATGRMLNRKVQSMGTKTSLATWVATVTITIS